MKAPFIALLSLVFTAGLIQQVVGVAVPGGPGLECDSLCAGCQPKAGKFTDNIKFSCKTHDNQPNNCGTTCPSGYEHMYCAEADACQ